MDPSRNPFSPGAGTMPVALAGRNHVIEAFDTTLERLQTGRSSVAPLITGPRGSGKTAILNYLLIRAKQKGWFVANEESIPQASLGALISILAREVLMEMSARHRRNARIKRALGVLKAFSSISAVGVTLNIDAAKIPGTADSGIFDRDLRQLFIELGEVAREHGTGVVFGLDEIQILNEDQFSSLNAALHQAAQRQLPIAFVGAGLFPSWRSGHRLELFPTTYEARMYASSYLRLDPLSPAESKVALSVTAQTEGATFTEQAADVCAAFSEGSPWLLQMAGHESWNASDSAVINDGAAQVACQRVESTLQQWFFPRLLSRCGIEEIEVLQEVARSEACPASFYSLYPNTQDRASRLKVLAQLAHRDLILLECDFDPRYEDFRIHFTVARLRSHLRKWRTLST